MTEEAPRTELDEMSTRALPDSPFAGNPDLAFAKAMELVRGEVNVQLRMWGSGAERTDAKKRELMAAAMTSLDLVALKSAGLRSREASKIAKADFYPADWQPNAFRDYGTDVANLQVAAAYLVAEMARKLMNGEDFDRAPRPAELPYVGDKPFVSSAVAGSHPSASDVV